EADRAHLLEHLLLLCLASGPRRPPGYLRGEIKAMLQAAQARTASGASGGGDVAARLARQVGPHLRRYAEAVRRAAVASGGVAAAPAAAAGDVSTTTSTEWLPELEALDIPGLKLVARGKVRDLYDVDDKHLLFVATDRISAFDVIMKNGIPDKGKLLTGMSVFWFGRLAAVAGRHHLVTANVDEMPEPVRAQRAVLEGRCMLVRKLKIVPCEAIVRGYLA
ncbi:Bifunctional purine biosynthetic protein ade1, partial [Cladochytrium tenue]